MIVLLIKNKTEFLHCRGVVYQKKMFYIFEQPATIHYKNKNCMRNSA